ARREHNALGVRSPVKPNNEGLIRSQSARFAQWLSAAAERQQVDSQICEVVARPDKRERFAIGGKSWEAVADVSARRRSDSPFLTCLGRHEVESKGDPKLDLSARAKNFPS